MYTTHDAAMEQGLQAPPTAVFCYNDLTAIGLMLAARRAGLSVPGDLAVVGFDDIPFALYIYPSLTTIAQPKPEMGKGAVDMVLSLVSAGDRVNAKIPASGRQVSVVSDIVVQGRLVVRESSTSPHEGISES